MIFGLNTVVQYISCAGYMQLIHYNDEDDVHAFTDLD